MNTTQMLNILPINDIELHTESEECRCNPKCETYNGVLIVTHNSFDGRELEEVEANKYGVKND